MEAGIVRIVVPGWDVPSSEAALELASRHRDLLVAAVGVHPHDAASVDAAGWAAIESMAGDPSSGAIGEIGLDFHRNLSPPEVQREALLRQLDLAARVGKPVLVHDRDAHQAVTETLLEWTAQSEADDGSTTARPPGALHAFSGDAQMAASLSAAGFLISFALPLAFRSAVGPRAAAAAIPAAALLTETDAPFLGPGPERRNEPITAIRVAVELARLRATLPETIAGAAGANLERLLGGWGSPEDGTRLATEASSPSSPRGGS